MSSGCAHPVGAEAPSRDDRPTREIYAIADESDAATVLGLRHGRQDHPCVGRRIVCFHGAEGPRELTRRQFAREGDNPAVIHHRAPAAPGGRHRGLERPDVRRRVVFLVQIAGAGGSDAARTEPTANHVDLAVDDRGVVMVPGRWHRRPLLPRVGLRVVHLVHAGDARAGAGVEGRQPADHVNLAVQLFGLCCAHLDGEGRQRLPRIGGGIVFPRVVHGCRAGELHRAAAKRVDPVLKGGLRLMMHRLGHRFLLGPPICCGVVFVHEPLRIARLAESSNDVHLSVHGERVELFLRFGKRRGG